jgi:isopenicillin-N N-acyltransferase-like protein
MKLKKTAIILSVVIVILISLFLYSLLIFPPEQDLSVINASLRRIHTKNTYKYGSNWLKKEKEGMWCMYVEGDDFERGYAIGILTKELAQKQEDYLVSEVEKKIPNRIYRFFLKIFIGWFNRDIDEHIPLEYKKEIYGVSLFASKNYSYIAPAYQRLLNYHAAHDIGHAVQNMHLVACTALGNWNNYAEDSSMYIGRNFDFFVGEDFAKEKIIAFVNPTHGHQFMSVTWGGMSGVLSGMNVQGLTITLNADKSEIPSQTGTPVSIIARDILQYASTIDEAYAIAKKYRSFVSESFMIGSAIDQKIAVIEKTPETTAIYYPNENRIVCSNHFQSKELKGTAKNIENINDSTSMYRQLRTEELLNAVPKMNERKMASLLRDQKGLQGRSIGMGNEKVVNQLIAHHSIIFNPYKKLVWVSTSPFQLGEFLAFDLNEIFKYKSNLNSLKNISETALNIPADSFLFSSSYKDFLFYKKTSDEITAYLNKEKKDLTLSDLQIKKYITSNLDFFNVYLLLGDYLQKKENYNEAIKYYRKALSKELPSVSQRKSIQNKITACLENNK